MTDKRLIPEQARAAEVIDDFEFKDLFLRLPMRPI
jgi:hypothetical protein